MSLAASYSKRIARGVTRLGVGLSLSRSGAPLPITAIILPTAVQIVSSGATAAQIRQSSAQSNSYATANTSPQTMSNASSSSMSALPTITLLQDAAQTVPAANDTFVFDGLTWTVQAVSFEYIQGLRVGIVTTATGPAIT